MKNLNVTILSCMLVAVSLSASVSLGNLAEIDSLTRAEDSNIPWSENRTSCQSSLAEPPREFLFQEMSRIREAFGKKIIGQEEFIDRIMIALLVNKGHLLVSGDPGVAKTRTLKVLSEVTEGTFTRIQFRNDMSASDITTSYVRDDAGQTNEKIGKINHNFILADEINRGSAKAQSGLLEPMEEGQVSLLSGTFTLPRVFLVLATQNPLGDRGTMELPYAQMDRFLMKVNVNYPEFDEEKEILDLYNQEELGQNGVREMIKKVSLSTIEQARISRARVSVSDEAKNFIVQIGRLTRPGNEAIVGLQNGKILQGSGPRGSIALLVASQARAWLDNRDEVTPADIESVAADVLRHRIVLDRTTRLANPSDDEIIKNIVQAAKSLLK